MSDVHIENSLVGAMEIIADSKVAGAGYDKTIIAIIKQIKQKASGAYIVSYQDSLFEAKGNPNNTYAIGQSVLVKIPNNDWGKDKIIERAVNQNALQLQQFIPTGEKYNKKGTNLITNNFYSLSLSSYKDNEIVLYDKDNSQIQDEYIIIDEEAIRRYVKTQGGGFALGLTVRTDIAKNQTGGDYGLEVTMRFTDTTTGTVTDKSFICGSANVLGNPYNVSFEQYIQTFIQEINIDQFDCISKIVLFSRDFKIKDDEKSEIIKDIFFSNITLFAGVSLSQEQYDSYFLNIDYSDTGRFIDKQEQGQNQKEIKLTAQLKIHGQIVTSDVTYYWFQEDATVSPASQGYHTTGGSGWYCLNQQDENGKITQQTQPNFYFVSGIKGDNVTQPCFAVQAYQTKIKCVAILNGARQVSGQTTIIDENQNISIYITSSDKLDDGSNQTVYYLGYGTPTFTCNVKNKDTGENIQNLKYIWSVFTYNGKKRDNPKEDSDYQTLKLAWEGTWKPKYDSWDRKTQLQANEYIYPPSQQPDSGTKQFQFFSYKKAKTQWELVQFEQRIKQNVYYYFPVSSIVDFSRIVCTVKNNDNVLLGTAQIIIYNKVQLQGQYNLIINNGTQIYQYDQKGNSPTGRQLEKPLKIQPLSFTLFDNQGKIVSNELISQYGNFYWIVPNQNTLIVTKDKDGEPYNDNLMTQGKDQVLNGIGLPAAADYYDVYQGRVVSDQGNDVKVTNLYSFIYSIAENYDQKNIYNNILLKLQYKQNVFKIYTDFSFPKMGDPGTNGTDYISKIVPGYTIENTFVQSSTDRVYLTNDDVKFFDDNGQKIDKLKFQLYNNSSEITVDRDKVHWELLAAKENSVKPFSYIDYDLVTNDRIYISPKKSGDYSIKQPVEKVCNIIRGYFSSDELNYFAEYPFCTNYIKVKNGGYNEYRIKIVPKTGFKYVVYAQDGTNPVYDNTLPFEIIIQKLQITKSQGESFSSQAELLYGTTDKNSFSYEWGSFGNVEIIPQLREEDGEQTNKCSVKPKDKFNGDQITTAIYCKIIEKETVESEAIQVGYIHIPIYMILNRYGHSALNDWDGNSIDLGKKEDGTSTGVILSPQIGAGKKQTDNSFTGILMGQFKDNTNEYDQEDGNDVGLMGFNKGQRTIFLDSKTGKAQFGKNGTGKIIIDPSQKVGTGENEKDAALLYSNNFNVNKYLPNADLKDKNNEYINYQIEDEQGGMMIDLTTPQIAFASGTFNVAKDGHMHASSGDIAGWQLSDEGLYKYINATSQQHGSKTGMMSNGDPVFYAYQTILQDGQQKDIKNFYVNRDGYLFSKFGKIGGWDIDSSSLSSTYNNIVTGMNADADPNTSSSTVSIDGNTKSKAFFSNEDNFYVTHDGYLRSTSGKIADWDINTKYLSNYSVGMGTMVFPVQENNNNPFGEQITATIWGGNNVINTTTGEAASDLNGLNFALRNDGKIYAQKGKIGGWNLQKTKLWAGQNGENGNTNGIRLNANGSMQGGNTASKGWIINNDGSSIFTSIEANDITIKSGKFQTISSGKISFGSDNSTMYIDGNGIYGTGFEITNTYAKFTGLVIDNQGVHSVSGSSGVSGGGVSLGASGGYIGGTGANSLSYGSSGLKVKDDNGVQWDSLQKAVKNMTVQALDVSTTLKFQNVYCSWQQVIYVHDVDVDGQTGTVTGVRRRAMWTLCGDQGFVPDA